MLKKITCLLALAWCLAAEVPSEDDRKVIAEEHTKIRENVEPTASNMLMMAYSMELEGLADKWANKCTLEKPDAGKDVEYANTSITTDFTENKTYAEMIEKFGQQSYFYNYSTNKCKVPCSSYIQAVWADSKEVGCATNKCPGILPSQKADTLFICVYKPA
uniref:SCP domain-containing protein n=1 Tax=Mesocestoides corti TaxID=53468 RepID=A0A5K3FM87_MESCO